MQGSAGTVRRTLPTVDVHTMPAIKTFRCCRTLERCWQVRSVILTSVALLRSRAPSWKFLSAKHPNLCRVQTHVGRIGQAAKKCGGEGRGGGQRLAIHLVAGEHPPKVQHAKLLVSQHCNGPRGCSRIELAEVPAKHSLSHVEQAFANPAVELHMGQRRRPWL